MTKTIVLLLLNDTSEETCRYFDLPKETLSRTYGPGKWNVRQILHHLTNTEYLFIGRLKKIIAEPKQVIWAFNQEDWDLAFDYVSEPLDGKQQLYSLCRKMNCRLVDEYFDLWGHKEYVHNETGLRTLKAEFEKVALHNDGHIKRIKTALR